jgi:spore germination protein
MKRSVFLLCFFAVACLAHADRFPEIWAYLMKGEEHAFPSESYITDIACFSAQVDGNGNLKGGHRQPPSLPTANPAARYHLVITIPWNSTLAHIYLDPKLPFRSRIIEDIVERSKAFDGVQIDFESVSKEDGTAYLNFLAAIKKALPEDKIFSVAVMARWAAHKEANPDDAFDYPFIGIMADRVVIMAYDEHYRGGSPGPIASLPWCKKIFDYALSTIDPQKLVMGIPLYGRGWQSPSHARAYKNSEVVDELLNRQIHSSCDPATGGTYSFTDSVTITVHYETIQSLESKINLYRKGSIRGVAFWRISQEPDGFWSQFKR